MCDAGLGLDAAQDDGLGFGLSAFICSTSSGRHMVKQVLACGTMLNLASSISGTVGPRPLGYCSVANVGTV